MKMLLHAQKLSGNKLISIRPDGANELTKEKTKDCLDANMTIIEEIPLYSPDSNGRSERPNHTMFEESPTILSELKMLRHLDQYKQLWTEAVTGNSNETRGTEVNTARYGRFAGPTESIMHV